ncbi:MAG: GGDEF domain-containing protein [Negativicutes bacterium]|nr:GGDEF domain-containing protein [Negativicutes bacterium]
MVVRFPTWIESLGELEPDYRAHYLAADALQVSVVIAVWQIPNILLAFVDYQFFADSPQYGGLVIARILLLLLSLWAIYALRRTPGPREFDRFLLSWFPVALTIILYLDAVWAARVPGIAAINVLVVFTSYLVIPSRMVTRVAPGLFLTTGNLLLYHWLGKTVDLQSLYMVLVAHLMANLLGVIFSARLFTYRRKEFLAMTKEAKVKAELSRLACTDELTGVLNRRRLLELAQGEFLLFKHSGRPLSVLMIDLDYFKKFNDTHGHYAGDKILTEFSGAVAEKIRHNDIWGRVGGEEFVLVLPETTPHHALTISERFRIDAGQLSVRIGEQLLGFTVSIGLTQATAADHSFLDVLKRADKALYRAKKNGRNRTEVA